MIKAGIRYKVYGLQKKELGFTIHRIPHTLNLFFLFLILWSDIPFTFTNQFINLMAIFRQEFKHLF